MTTVKPRKIFVNLAVRDLERSKAFFAKLGFGYNAAFTNENAASMIVSEEATVMLLVEKFFRTFTQKELANSGTHTEAILALSCDSKEEVDHMVKTAVESGGSAAMPAMDHGFMYGGSFYDPDGHHFEVVWMDMSQMPS